LAIVVLLGAAGDKRLSLRELKRVFPHGDSAHVIREASFSTHRLGRGEHQLVSYVERGRLHALLAHDGRTRAFLQDDTLLAHLQFARVADVDGDGRNDVLFVYTYQQPALGTVALGAQVLLQRAGGSFRPAPQWVARVRRKLLKVDPSVRRDFSTEDMVAVFRQTPRHGP
jgi:hypothetical protein